MVYAIEEIEQIDLVDPKDAFYPTMPPLNIELSSRCNFKCPYCANPTLTRDYEAMSDEVFEDVVTQAKQNNQFIVALHGVGEPLLRKDLEVLLRKMGSIWNGCITTNGALLSLSRMASLYEAGLRYVYVSVDTLDPVLFKRTRGGVLDKVIGNVREAAKKYSDVVFWIGLMNHKEQVIGEVEKERFQDLFGDLPHVTMRIYENGRFPGAAEDWRHPERNVRGTRCYTPSAYLTIDARGKVSLCCADQNTEHVLGDIRKSSLKEIWYSRSNQNTFRDVALGLKGCPEVCYKCVLVPQDTKLDEIDPIWWGPNAELVAAAEKRRDEGDLAGARSLIDFALVRDPKNADIQMRKAEIEERALL